MKLYHGTTEQAAHQIRLSGLQSRPDQQFRVHLGMDNDTRPHVTTDMEIAQFYADFRANYEKALVGQWIPFGQLGQQLQKVGGDWEPRAKPAIVEFNVPDNWPLENDWRDRSDTGYISNPIPAQYVSRIMAVN